MPESPTPAWEQRIEEIQKKQERYLDRYAGPQSSTPQYHVSDMIYLRGHHLSDTAQKFHAGFGAKWEGTFPVQENEVYLIDKQGVPVKVHQTQITPARVSTQ